MNNGFQIFAKEAELIQVKYPELKLDVDEKSGAPCLTGFIQLTSQDGCLIDSYNLKIIAGSEYPTRFPYVFETGGRIPINIDWHVFPGDGHCCISSFPDEILICKRGLVLSDFIENHLMPYLFNQKYRENNGFFLKERPHGNKGNIQFFTEVFKTDDLFNVVNGLYFIMQRKEPNRVSKCFCGSGEKYRKCHRECYRILDAFTNQELIFFIRMILQVR